MFTLFRLQRAQIGLTLRDVEIALMLETARTDIPEKMTLNVKSVKFKTGKLLKFYGAQFSESFDPTLKDDSGDSETC